MSTGMSSLLATIPISSPSNMEHPAKYEVPTAAGRLIRMDNNRIIKSYVWHLGRCFFVSTIERDSSATEGPRRFNETLVWDYVWETATPGAMIAQGDGPAGSIKTHMRICEQLFRDGKVDDAQTY